MLFDSINILNGCGLAIRTMVRIKFMRFIYLSLLFLVSCGPTYTKTYTSVPRVADGVIRDLRYVPPISNISTGIDWEGNPTIDIDTEPEEYHVIIEVPKINMIFLENDKGLYNKVYVGKPVLVWYKETWKVDYERKTKTEIPGSRRLEDYILYSVNANPSQNAEE